MRFPTVCQSQDVSSSVGNIKLIDALVNRVSQPFRRMLFSATWAERIALLRNLGRNIISAVLRRFGLARESSLLLMVTAGAMRQQGLPRPG